MHQVDFNTFALEKGQNVKQYMKFVIEREYLRSIYPKPSEQTKAEYEEYLANKALDNTFNFYHLFNNKNTAYAKRVNNVLMEHPDLARRFEILGNLRLENDKDNTIFNLSVTDKDINQVYLFYLILLLSSITRIINSTRIKIDLEITYLHLI